MRFSFSLRRAAIGSVSALALTAFPLTVALAQDAPSTPKDPSSIALPELAVEGEQEPETPATIVVAPKEDGTKRIAPDLGALLSDLPGITAGRMGSHASDIVIRGQSQDRLAVINDGGYSFGGCPNRMDPPTSMIPDAMVDTLTVQRGYQTVVNGAPAPGGSVIVERSQPSFDQFTVTGAADASIEGNGMLRKGSVTSTAGAELGYVRAFGEASKASNYKDGQGNEIRSAFESKAGGVEIGWTPVKGSSLSISTERMESTNVLFAGAGMDGVYDGSTTYRLKGEHAFQDAGPLQKISFTAYKTLVDHLMDNFSLRTPTTMKMATPSTSNTYGGTVSLDWTVRGVQVTSGIDHRTNTRDATSYTGMATSQLDPATISGYMWPDVSIADTGIFTEAKAPLGTASTLTAGLRLDLVDADANKADDKPQNANPTARTLYAQYYGSSNVSSQEQNVSGVLRLDHDFGPVSGWAGISRSVRTADATERGIARSAGASSWVGNPNLKPEKHHQIDAGLSTKHSDWSASSGVWYDDVTDFITRDNARGQSGVLQTNGASIFRNVDARLAGVDLAGSWKPVPELKLTTSVTYTYGDNTSDSRPLYQIPPLQGFAEAAYTVDSVTFGPRLRWAATQTRVDTDGTSGSGLDVQKTSGYGVFDLFATWQPLDGVELRAGVNNIFDHTYANHLSRSNSVDPTLVQVNEAGRSFSMGGRVSF